MNHTSKLYWFLWRWFLLPSSKELSVTCLPARNAVIIYPISSDPRWGLPEGRPSSSGYGWSPLHDQEEEPNLAHFLPDLGRRCVDSANGDGGSRVRSGVARLGEPEHSTACSLWSKLHVSSVTHALASGYKYIYIYNYIKNIYIQVAALFSIQFINCWEYSWESDLPCPLADALVYIWVMEDVAAECK